MADATLSGYKATIATVGFTGTQQFTALTDNEWTDLSDAIDNSTNKYMFVDLEINLGTLTPSGADAAIEIYLLPAVNGTDAPEWEGGGTTNDEQVNNQYFVGSVTTDAGSAGAQLLVLRNVALPNGNYFWGIRNRANVTLNATNTLEWRPHQYAST